MDKLWVVTANAARARVWERARSGDALSEVVDLVHPESRWKVSELADDKSGHSERGTSNSGHGSTQFEARTDPLHKQHEKFARDVATQIDQAVASGRCGALVLLASNPFLGVLKGHLGTAAAQRVRASHASDFTAVSARELGERVDALLRAAD